MKYPATVFLPLCISSTLCLANPVYINTDTPNPPKVKLSPPKQHVLFNLYKHTVPTLRIKTKLPIVLPPSELLNDLLKFKQPLSTHSVKFAYHYAYAINFDYIANCDNAPICSAGNYYVFQLRTRAPININQNARLSRTELSAIAQDDALSQTFESHHPVLLKQHIQGYIENANPAYVFRTLTWCQKNLCFQLTLKNQTDRAFVHVANATISELTHYDQT